MTDRVEPEPENVALSVGELVSTEPATLPGPNVLTGQRVTLRPVDPAADVEDLYRGSHGSAEREALWTYMAYGPFVSPETMGEWLEGCRQSTDPQFVAVVENATDKAVGMASFQRIVPSNRCIEVAHIWYHPEQQRTRTNSETVFLLLSEAFDRLGNRRVEWKCDALNDRSRAAALRLGFRFEGIFRQHMIIKGRNRDTAWFAMTDADWRIVRPVLERWLYAGEQFSLTAAVREVVL